ncbi:integrase [Synergistales bacterium]|nr:integrase [Synergistales bacterium]
MLIYWIRDTLVNGFVMSVSYGGKKTFCVDYRRPNGKRGTYKIGDATRYNVAEAREVAQQFLASIERGEDPINQEKKLTFGGFVSDIYESWVIENRKSGDSTAYIIKSNFKFLFDTPLDEITIAQIEQWRSKRKKAGLKDSSINRLITALKAAINWAVKRNIIENNPIAKLEQLSEEDSDTKVRYLTKEERTRLIDALDAREKKIKEGYDSHNEWRKVRGMETAPPLKADHLKPIVLLGLYTGIRRNSLLSLEWRDVNFDEKTILVRAATSKSGKQYYVPMNKIAFDTLLNWRNNTKRTAPGSLVFPSPQTGKKMGDCRSSWESLMKAAKIEHFRWHDMRHDFASQLVMKGVDLNTVRELMGHADLKMTLRYAHLAPNIKMKAVEMLEDDIISE